MRRELLIGFLLLAAVTAVYWPVHSYPFVLLDDYGYIVENPYVRNGLTCEGMLFAFTGVTVGNWHPVTMLSHMLDCQLFGVETGAGWHHVVNLALHAANTILLFIALRRMTGAVWRSTLVAALFGLHPLHVESVAWVSERKDVLCTLFFILTLLAYGSYVQRPTILRYAAVFVLLALGLMAKPMLVTVPFVLLLLDYWPLQRIRQGAGGVRAQRVGEQGAESGEVNQASATSLARLVVEKIPLLVLVAISAAITCVAQQRGGAFGMLGQVPLGTRLGNALFSYGQYLEKSVWPSPLAAIYPYVNRKPIDVLIIGLALVAISVAAIRLAKIRPYVLVGWCWYLGTLVPVIGLVQVGMQSMADRYTYIPLIGIFIIAAWGAADFTEDWPTQNKAIAAAAVLALCGWFTWRQVTTWSSSEALYSHAVEAERYNSFALHGLGMAYWKDGKLDEAQQQFEAMVKIQSDPALHLEGGLEPGYRALGLLLAVRHQPKKALEQFDQAIEARPQQPEPLRHKAWLLATSLDGSVRDGQKAIASAEQALQLSPGKEPEYWDTLAAAQAEAGQFQEAVASAEKALQQARSMRADDLIAGIQQRLELYKSGMPYRAEAQPPQRL
ncbi:MAG: hypothetical protein ACLP9L_37675 [Thermoguttaceae bacterium]